MDRCEAREILSLFRPGTKDAEDPKIAEALRYAQTDEELARWFAGHCSLYVTMRARLKEIPVPSDLQARIMRIEAQQRGKIIDLRKWWLPLTAAAMVALLGIISWMIFSQTRQDNFSDYRDRMAKLPQRGYAMTMFNTNLVEIHTYLLSHQCPDYTLPKPLTILAGEGCATLAWRDRNVSMICLKDPASQHAVYLFAMDAAKVENAPASSQPEFRQVRDLMTASWTVGDKIYVLAATGTEAELKRYLN
ncbi:MAG TPA: hypothetical protein VH413_09745 [Verrucomicrobiae bacterium]|jgi:hypothetical protein|nr:hypothetical protein [Verrucomicrobiae bacterium]